MDLRIIPRLHRATHQVGMYIAREKLRFPVSQPEAHVLAFVFESEGGCSLSDLHRSFGHKRSTLTSLVDRLEERGLIERQPHETDRRAFALRLTREGTRLARAVHDHLQRLEALVVRKAGAAQLEAFAAVLDAIEEATRET